MTTVPLSKDVIRELREETGAGIVDIQKALSAADGDRTKAIDLLRKQGKKIAAKKAERTTREGIIGCYVHANGKIAALVALACETDFVARNDTFRELAHDLALHVAAMNPPYVTPDDVPEDVLEREREIAREQALAEGKPPAVVGKIIEGKIQKFFDDTCFLRQPFVKDDQLSVAEVIDGVTAKVGEKVEVRRILRLAL